MIGRMEKEFGAEMGYLNLDEMGQDIFARFRPLLHGPKLRKPPEEDDRKAVFEKTERTV